MLKTVVLSSLHRVFPDCCPQDSANNRFSCLADEPLNFQIAYIKSGEGRNPLGINIRIETELPISFYYAERVAVLRNDPPGLTVPGRAGLYPDILLPKKINPTLKNESPFGNRWFEKGEQRQLCAIKEAWQTLFFTVNENARLQKAGNYTVSVVFLSADTNKELCRESISVKIIPQKLEPQKLICTNWFYGDCLCDAHHIKPMSDEFFKAVGNYARKAALNGQNMFLTPCFTPPLDTPPGCYRQKIQLVGIKVTEEGEYLFDFSLLKRYIRVCQKAGIRYFEHSHLFTQWGAKAAPQIWAEVKGKEKRIFGWNTKASGRAYRRFLKAYLPAVTAFFRENGLEKKVLFHISDEPDSNMIASYKQALEGVGNMLEGFMVGDALSHYEIYEQGLVQTPIVATDCVHNFVGRCKNFWCYYTGGQIKDGLSNRLHVVSAERNRMIGVHMYTAGVKGFLHWGYNYYYDMFSHGFTDPRLQPGNYMLSAGTSYLVYPADHLDCYQSVRQKVFAEGILDLRALNTLEKLKGRSAAEAIIEKHFGNVGFFTAPDTPEAYLAFREELNRAISE